ncbi:MAG: galactokinase, partial [Treponema sp.]|nr:galactokinase [Treponema sp.]
MNEKELAEKIASERAGELFARLYGADGVEAARQRYAKLAEGMADRDFPANEQGANDRGLRVFSAPGRTELGGNHTDHNSGKVLAASIQLDNVAIVRECADASVFFRSSGHRDVCINLADNSGKPDLQPHAEEQGKTEALVRGIAAELHRRGTPVNGFSANATSSVLTGSGLSSSAAVEVLIGRIFDTLSGDGKRSPLEIARIGQIAENDYFGKPCGLMDQTACAYGGAVAIDFAKLPDGEVWPHVQQIDFNPAAVGYTLCVVNTAGSHADLTPDYAAIPSEMKSVAALFGKAVLAELDRDTVLGAAADVRKKTGDRALLRALHFFDENDRVDEMAKALKEMDSSAQSGGKLSAFSRFMDLVNQSGDSSWQLLQNVYSAQDVKAQGISIALALSKNFFRR